MKGSKLFSYPWVIDMSLENHWSVTFIRRCIDFLTTCACIICYLIDIAVDHLIRWPSTTLLEGLEAASSGCKIAPSTLGYSLISSGVPHSLFPQWWEFILEGALSRAPRPCRVSPQEALRRKILLLLHHPITIMCSSPVNCAVEMGGWTFLACRASRRSLLPHSLSLRQWKWIGSSFIFPSQVLISPAKRLILRFVCVMFKQQWDIGEW